MTTDLRLVAGLMSCLLCPGAQAADVKAGKMAAQTHCIQCHAAHDWDGEDASSLESLIRDIAAGKVKHKQKITLSDADIANIAAYWGQGRD